MARRTLLRYLTVLGITPCLCLFADTINTSAASFESALSSFTTTGFNSISVPSGGSDYGGNQYAITGGASTTTRLISPFPPTPLRSDWTTVGSSAEIRA